MSRPSSPYQATVAPCPLPGVVAGMVLAVGVSAVVLALRWQQDWNLSEGTYALTARVLLHGGDLYGTTVVAHPPGMFLLGAGVLLLHDSLDSLRVSVAVLQLVAVGLLAVVVGRVTRSPWATAATPPIAVALPWAVHEQGIFQGEAVALPLLAAAAVLGARPRTAPWAGGLLALAVAVKLPMLLPALFGVWFAADRRRAGVAFIGVLVLVGGASLAAFGGGVVEQTVLAQLEVGRHAPRYVLELAVQAGWNLAPLLLAAVPALVAWRRGWRSADEAQWRLACALALGTALTFGSALKEGTSLSILPPVEALFVPLSVTGGWLWWRGGGSPSAARGLVAAACLGALLVQPVSLLAAPDRGGVAFLRPFSARAWTLDLTREQTAAWVARLERCPSGMPSAAPATVTFRARRRMPADQPDQFLPTRAARLRAVAHEMAAAGPRCP